MSTANTNSTTFQSVAAASKTGAAPRKSYDDPYSKRLFLIIDSLPEMQRALAMTLSSFGADKVEYASKAGDALAKMGKYEFDVVLCDYDLGNGYDGLYLFEEVKERNLIKQSCVFMIVTGERRSQRVISAAELGPDDYLLKPFTGEVLRERLEKAMRRREAFRLVDEAIMRHEYLSAIEVCSRLIGERGEFTLDFMKLKGSLALKIGDFDSARSLYMDVLRIKPVPWAKMGLAKSLTGLKAYDEARLLFEEVLTDNDRVMEAYDWLAKLYRSNHNLDEAQATLKQATDISPVVFRRQQQLAEVALLNNQLEVAEDACQTTLDIAKYTWHRSPTHYAALARVQLARGDTANVGRTLSNLRRDYRYNEEGEWMASVVDSQLQSKKGNRDKARQLFSDAETKFRQLAPKLSSDAQMEFARACYAQGHKDAGNSVMRDLVRNHHDDEELLARFGDMFEEVGLGEDGRQLIADNVQSVLELNNQAVREAQAGQFDSAIERFVKAHEEMPQNIQVMLNLINATMAYVHRQGWHESHMRRAHDMLSKVRDLAPTNNKFQKILQAWRMLVEKLGKPQWVL
ncbi:tetratricopeptide (TPR) repeat protein [Chromobacterium alkanivorans]|uniref:tetratricopeptide repeat-containing response regulator n=1 Tax=Chromobacterium alkanivorans TaxID=1071719 RepID=UPI0019676741|nr:tetratricopeptide repeat-containing response regulator [Chromobacterium alkanivorans]MBN3004035.1 response regulator [Chromobacterium alkanivorans]MCS3805558.1 tetratricopeptide (TPR) repeat protein [Chromobacterium alkanivorans]MCS3819897.1 tetratricopeptide (TPR) repeat protein [Chromobacterium alkanivorans]MCS3874128.1 tetratricopeptide (TPR) repeat protein [Chromobacterium alkanivorans]